MTHDPSDLGLICLIKEHKIRFRILSVWDFFKETHPKITVIIEFHGAFMYTYNYYFWMESKLRKSNYFEIN